MGRFFAIVLISASGMFVAYSFAAVFNRPLETMLAGVALGVAATGVARD